LQLIEEDGSRLTFLGRRPAQGELTFVAVDPQTLLAAAANLSFDASAP
jgi:hypothetical protein